MESLVNGISYILLDVMGYSAFNIIIILIAILLIVFFTRMSRKKQIKRNECFVYIAYSIISVLMLNTVYCYFYNLHVRNQLRLDGGNWTSMSFIAADMSAAVAMIILSAPLIIFAICTFRYIINDYKMSKKLKILFCFLTLLPCIVLASYFYHRNV